MITAHDALTLLTDNEAKARAYGNDIYFRDGWQTFVERASNPVNDAQNHAVVVVKPDLVVSRKVETFLELLDGHGFTPVLATPVKFDRHVVRALWAYQLNAAPLAVVDAVDFVSTAGPSLFLLVADREGDGSGRGRGRLAALKGSSDPRRRPTHTLRSELGAASQLNNYFHCSDGAADVVRELGIWFDGRSRSRLLRQLFERGPMPFEAIADLIGGVYDGAPACQLNLEASVSRVLAAFAEERCDFTPPIGSQVADAVRGKSTTCSPEYLVSRLINLDTVDTWDRAVVIGHLVTYLPPIGTPIV